MPRKSNAASWQAAKNYPPVACCGLSDGGAVTTHKRRAVLPLLLIRPVVRAMCADCRRMADGRQAARERRIDKAQRCSLLLLLPA